MGDITNLVNLCKITLNDHKFNYLSQRNKDMVNGLWEKINFEHPFSTLNTEIT